MTKTENMTNILNFFSHEKISDRVYIVTENYSTLYRFTIGVFVGEERVLVVDSGLGMCGDLRKYIEGFVGNNKPIICVCTDGHPDHVGNAIQFDEMYLKMSDFHKFTSSYDSEHRLEAVDNFSLHNGEIIDYSRIVMVDNSKSTFKDINDGDMFHLGGISIEIIGLPGHSKGSLAIISRKDKIVFTGDSINSEVPLFDLDREGLLAFRDTLNRFISDVDHDIEIYSGLKSTPQKIQVVKNIAAACEEVAEGKINEDVPLKTAFKDRDIRLHFVNNTCIQYNASLFK